MKTKKVLFCLVGLLLLVSLCLNLVLGMACRSLYRNLLISRIAPLGLSVAQKEIVKPYQTDQHGKWVLLFGDSRVAQWDPIPIHKDILVSRLGMSGWTTAQALYYLQSVPLKDVPDLVVIQLGINDLKAIGVFPERRLDIQEKCEQNLQTIADRFSRKGSKVVLLTIFPPGSVSLARRPVWSEDIRLGVQEVNENLGKSNVKDFIVFNCDEVFLRNGKMNREYMRDTLHINPRGYGVLNSVLEPIIHQVLTEEL